jgi:glyoxylase-like metal-dependent hydrolase (beta-lactamase superfamily II)
MSLAAHCTRRALGALAIPVLLAAFALVATGAAPAARDAGPSLWRLDCGTIEVGNLDDYSDTYQYTGRQKTFANSCYLIRNGDRFLLWDTGLPGELAGGEKQDGSDRMALRRRIREQLAEIGVRPEQVTFVGISHYHFDHTGQAADFAQATLLVDRRDWEAIQGRPDRAERFTPWLRGGKVEPLVYDHDVFGDGTVVMLATPGHTPGHRSLLVRLKERGPVLLSGDAVHFAENWGTRGVPGFNTSRAETLASMDRLAQLVRRLKATLVIQHEPADVRKLPPFPEAAR